MSQYAIGTVSIANGSTSVAGASTTWLTNVAAGDVFTISGDTTWYQIAGVSGDTQLTLAAPYAGATANGAAYVITRDFSPNRAYPLLNAQDVEASKVVSRAITMIDQDVGTLVSGATFDARYVKKSGDALTGALALAADPTQALHAATKQYVDGGLAGKQNTLGFAPTNKSGDTMTGALTIGASGFLQLSGAVGPSTNHWVGVGGALGPSNSLALYGKSGGGVEIGVANSAKVMVTANGLGVGSAAAGNGYQFEVVDANHANNLARVYNFYTGGQSYWASKTDAREFWAGTAGTIGGYPNGAYIIYDATAVASRIVIDDKGWAGLATAPSAPLHIANFGNGNVSSFRVDHSTGAGGVAGGWHLSSYYGAKEIAYVDAELLDGTLGAEASTLRFGTIGNGTLAERVRIDGAGNFGIGASPSGNGYKFEIADSGLTNLLTRVINNFTGGNSLAAFKNDVREFWTGTVGASAGFPGGAFQVADSTAGLVRMLIDQNGYVRIGAGYQGRTPANETLSTAQFMTNDGATQGLMGAYGDTGLVFGTYTNHSIYFRTNNANHMFLSTSGYLGIGTTPNYRVHIAGGSVLNFFSNQTDGTSYAAQITQDGAGLPSLFVNASSASYVSYLMSNSISTADSAGYGFYVANNTSGTRFYLRGDGNAFAHGTWNNSSLDYAEYFESSDGSVIPLGTAVVLVADKVRAATACDNSDDIIGVIRPKGKNVASTVVGGTAWNEWNGRWLTDEFGQKIWETYEVVEWMEGEGDKRQARSYEVGKPPDGVVAPPDAVTKTMERPTENPRFDPKVDYVPREERPEWHVIGLVGQVPVRKGQPVRSSWRRMRDVSTTVELWFVR